MSQLAGSLAQAAPRVGPLTTVDAVAGMMAKGRSSAVLVVDAANRLLGIATERDILRKVSVPALSPAATLVASIMTSEPHFVDETATAFDAMSLMTRGHFRHLPVCRAGSREVIGLIDSLALGGTLAAQCRDAKKRAPNAAMLAHLTKVIRAIVTRSEGDNAATVYTLPASMRVSEAITAMSDRSVSALLVTDDSGALVGIFTERDVVARVVARDVNTAAATLAEVMTVRPQCISPQQTAQVALTIMMRGHFRHVPIVASMSDGTAKIIGLLDVAQLLQGALVVGEAKAEAAPAHEPAVAPSVFTRAVSWFSSRVLAPIADLLLEVDGLDDEDVCCCSADGWATAPPPRVVSTRTQDGDGADDADAPMPLVPSEAAPSPAPADAASLSPVAPAAVVPDIRSLALPAPTAAVCARVIALQQAGNAAALESRFDVAVTKYGFALMRLGAMAEEPAAASFSDLISATTLLVLHAKLHVSRAELLSVAGRLTEAVDDFAAAVAAASASEAVVAAAHAAGIEAPTEAELRAAAEAAAASAVPYAMMLRPEMRARLRLGHTNALVEAGRYEDAMRAAQRTGEISAAVCSLLEAEKPKLVDVGRDLYGVGDFTGSLASYSRALRASACRRVLQGGDAGAAEDAYLLSNCAACRQQMGDLSGAIEDARASLALDPKFSKSSLRLASCLQSQERYAEAIKVAADGIARGNGDFAQKLARVRDDCTAALLARMASIPVASKVGTKVSGPLMETTNT